MLKQTTKQSPALFTAPAFAMSSANSLLSCGSLLDHLRESVWLEAPPYLIDCWNSTFSKYIALSAGHFEARGVARDASHLGKEDFKALRQQIVRLTEQAACISSSKGNLQPCQQVIKMTCFIQTFQNSLLCEWQNISSKVTFALS